MQMQARLVWLRILCFDFSFYFPFLLAFPELSSLRAHFRPFTEVVRKFRREVMTKVWENFREKGKEGRGESVFFPGECASVISCLAGDIHRWQEFTDDKLKL